MQFRGVFMLAILALLGVLSGGSAAEEARFISNPRQLIYEGKAAAKAIFRKTAKCSFFRVSVRRKIRFTKSIFWTSKQGRFVESLPASGRPPAAFFDPTAWKPFSPFTDGFDGLPVFTPDGRKLSWASARTEDGSPQIFIADWNHEAAQDELAQAPFRGAASR
ncbi:MAG: hypothetical protein WBL40_12580 [Terrimicrobiaceae bacterium]